MTSQFGLWVYNSENRFVGSFYHNAVLRGSTDFLKTTYSGTPYCLPYSPDYRALTSKWNSNPKSRIITIGNAFSEKLNHLTREELKNSWKWGKRSEGQGEDSEKETMGQNQDCLSWHPARLKQLGWEIISQIYFLCLLSYFYKQVTGYYWQKKKENCWFIVD